MDLINLLLMLVMGLSIFVTFVSLFYAVIKRSWQAMFVCFVASLPLSMYFLSVNPSISLLGFVPIILLVLTILLRKHSQKQMVH